MLDSQVAYLWITTILAIGVVVSAGEYWFVRHSFDHGSVYSWTIFREQYNVGESSLRVLYDFIGREQTVRAMILFRGFAGVLAIGASPQTVRFSVVWVVIALTGLYMSWRKPFGDDGADQMTNIVSITVCLCAVVGNGGFLFNLGLIFIAAQALLSYVTAGVAKLWSSSWRSGEAIFRVFNTESYGMRSIGCFLENKRSLSAILCWSVITFECAFLFAPFAPLTISISLLLVIACFHVSCAIIMGLNNFVWAFLSTFPALLYCFQFSSAVIWAK